MAQANNNWLHYFQGVLGQKPWRVRLGIGSFLLFDFGPRVKNGNHFIGSWYLWIKDCEWFLDSDRRTIVHSESPRHLIEQAVRNLGKYPLNEVQSGEKNDSTVFVFNSKFRLTCRPYADQAPEEEYWSFRMPDRRTVVALPGGYKVEDAPVAAHSKP